MTCIIGVEEDGIVYIAADSMSSDGYSSQAVLQPKVFLAQDKFLIGYTTSFRMGQLLEFSLAVRPKYEDEDDLKYMVTGFAETARRLFKDHGYAKTDGNGEEFGGVFLVGYNGHLYRVDIDFHVMRYTTRIAACGAGEDFALAAMLAMVKKPVKKRLRRSLEIVSELSVFVIPPFKVMKLPKK